MLCQCDVRRFLFFWGSRSHLSKHTFTKWRYLLSWGWVVFAAEWRSWFNKSEHFGRVQIHYHDHLWSRHYCNSNTKKLRRLFNNAKPFNKAISSNFARFSPITMCGFKSLIFYCPSSYVVWTKKKAFLFIAVRTGFFRKQIPSSGSGKEKITK